MIMEPINPQAKAGQHAKYGRAPLVLAPQGSQFPLLKEYTFSKPPKPQPLNPKP